MNNFKYVKRALYMIVGVVFIFLGITYIGMGLLLLLNGGNMYSFIFILPAPVCILVGVFYLSLHKRDYISFEGDYISIDRGFARTPFTFRLNEVEVSRVIGDKVRIGLTDGSEYRIIYSALSVLDIRKIEEILVDTLA